jgi:hypothetical protein
VTRKTKNRICMTDARWLFFFILLFPDELLI